MRKVGILGGVGPQATLFIYQRLIEIAQNKYNAKNNDDYPYVIFASVPVPDFISDTKNLEKAEQMLAEAAQGLVNAGCDALCIGSNTAHILLERLQAKTGAKFISMVELVADRCSALSYKKVALLGTPVLLKSGLYDQALKSRGIQLVHPSEEQIKLCDEVIRLVIAGQSVEFIKEEYIKVLSSMLDQGANAIILGCTELPLVLDYAALGERVMSSDKILAEGIADFCYQTTGRPAGTG